METYHERILLLSLLPILLGSCDFSDRRLKFINKTNKSLFAKIYTDTLPDFPSLNRTEFYFGVIIPSDSTYTPNMPEKNGWDKEIYRSVNKKLNVFIFQEDSLKKYHSIDSLISNKVYKRKSFTTDYLQKNNWIIKLDNELLNTQ